MTVRRAPLFLARRSYRRRRMADAARLLPFLGLFLILLPILWQPRLSLTPDTAWGGVYLFGVWVVLILGALLSSRVLGKPSEAEAAGAPDAEPEVTPGASDRASDRASEGHTRSGAGSGDGSGDGTTIGQGLR